jgi:hypothetical protein
MTNALQRRLEALEARLNSSEHNSGELPPGGPLRVLIVSGGLPSPDGPVFATAGQHEWLRDPGEDLGAFADRARAGARDAGVRLLIGGLPRSQAQHDVAMAAYDAWLLTDDGVPPMEKSWPSRRTPIVPSRAPFA